MDLRELESGIDQSTHWYYQNKKRPLLKYVAKKIAQHKQALSILDIGSGSGFFAYELEKKFGKKLSSISMCDINYTDEEVKASAEAFVKKTVALPEKIENTIVVMMDLLEHIEDDKGFVKDLLSRCGDNVYFFVTVPAFNSIWSGHDVYLGHYRRHTLKTIANLMKDISITKRYYIFMMLFPPAWFIRKLFGQGDEPKSDMKPLPRPINAFIRKVLSLEFLFNRGNKLFGLTCVLEGKK